MQRHIVIVDHTLSGHHFAFACQFSRALLSLGHRVTCVMPGWNRVQEWVQIHCSQESSCFSGMELVPADYPAGSRLRRMARAIRRWRGYARQIKNVESFSGKKVDLVFFAWLDSELDTFLPPSWQALLFPYYWSGLYFHPYHLRRTDLFLFRPAVGRDLDGLFLSRRCLAIALHDQAIVTAYGKRIRKPVLHFPETADPTPPEPGHPLAFSIREKAGGRVVVGIIGCEPHKGTLNLIRAIRKADPSRFFFALIGTLPEALFSAEDWHELSEFLKTERENVLTHFHPLREGAEYNAVFTAFDIPYLVYDDFISSSNRLTKAAIFERLVLAQDNYCVGADVRDFDLGEAIPPGNPDAVIDGLGRLAGRIREGQFPYLQWRHYRDLNSEAKLADRFRELLELLP